MLLKIHRENFWTQKHDDHFLCREAELYLDANDKNGFIEFLQRAITENPSLVEEDRSPLISCIYRHKPDVILKIVTHHPSILPKSESGKIMLMQCAAINSEEAYFSLLDYGFPPIGGGVFNHDVCKVFENALIGKSNRMIDHILDTDTKVQGCMQDYHEHLIALILYKKESRLLSALQERGFNLDFLFSARSIPENKVLADCWSRSSLGSGKYLYSLMDQNIYFPSGELGGLALGRIMTSLQGDKHIVQVLDYACQQADFRPTLHTFHNICSRIIQIDNFSRYKTLLKEVVDCIDKYCDEQTAKEIGVDIVTVLGEELKNKQNRHKYLDIVLNRIEINDPAGLTGLFPALLESADIKSMNVLKKHGFDIDRLFSESRKLNPNILKKVTNPFMTWKPVSKHRISFTKTLFEDIQEGSIGGQEDLIPPALNHLLTSKNLSVEGEAICHYIEMYHQHFPLNQTQANLLIDGFLAHSQCYDTMIESLLELSIPISETCVNNAINHFRDDEMRAIYVKSRLVGKHVGDKSVIADSYPDLCGL